MFRLKLYLYKALDLLRPRYIRQLEEIRREIWVHKGIYLNNLEAIETAISSLHFQEVVKRNGGDST